MTSATSLVWKRWQHVLTGIVVLTLPADGLAGQTDTAAATGDVSDSVATQGNTLVPLPVLFYQPETKFGFGVAATYYFRTSKIGPDARPSTLQPVLIFTTKKQIIAVFQGEIYSPTERYRYNFEGGYTRFPNSFWGIGNSTPDSLEEDYTPKSVSLALEAQREIFPNWYAGVNLRAGYRAIVETDSGGLLASGLVPGSEDGWIVGAGLTFTRDTRDNTVYPRSGSLDQFNTTLYSGFFGSSYDFASFTLDLRRYFTLFSNVLAVRGLGVATASVPPFDLTPQLGGDALLRGYFGGRFRDRQLMAFQAEYRLHIWWRLGGVGFVATGQVADSFGDFGFGDFYTSAGFGIRFLLSEAEGLNIRADWGTGINYSTTGFYLSLGEAF
jgi:outer membrane protein assembly factor BamA